MAIVPAKGRRVVLKVDMLVEGTDVPTGMTFRQAARKAVAMCVSDFAAKGVRPDSFLVSLGLPRTVSSSKVEELRLGFSDAEEEWGVRLVGGDTNEAKELVIDCAMIGFGDRVVGRSGARPGEILVVGGEFGLPPAGLKILMRGARASRTFREKAVSSVLCPNPNLRIGLGLAGFLTSAIDSSDGLARSIHTLAEESGVGFELSMLPAAEGVEKFASANKTTAEELVLNGGEEYVIVGTLKRRNFPAARSVATKSGGRLLGVGRVTEREGEVVLKGAQGSRRVPNEGWTHLS